MATSTISNTIEDPSGGDVEGIAVTVTLMPTAGFRVSDAVEVARTVSTTTDTNGAWSLALERNSNITPANTYYRVVEEIPASQGGRRTWNIQVGASNQTVSAALVTPLPDVTTSNFLTQASADARYQALSAIGSDTPSTIDPDDAAAAGASTAASRGDHVHAITTGTPVATGDANAEGAGTGFARDTHVHKGVVANDAWTTYTPTLTQSGAVTKTVTYAAYQRTGRMVTVSLILAVTGSGTASNTVTVSLPVTAKVANNLPVGIGGIFDTSVGTYNPGIVVFNTTTTAAMRPANSTTSTFLGAGIFTAALASGDSVEMTITYEAAS